MNLRDLVEQLAAILLAQGDMPVLSEAGHTLESVEFNDDDEGPCVLFLFGED